APAASVQPNVVLPDATVVFCPGVRVTTDSITRPLVQPYGFDVPPGGMTSAYTPTTAVRSLRFCTRTSIGDAGWPSCGTDIFWAAASCLPNANGAENSDVLPPASVAVAVTFGPVTASTKLQLPLASAVLDPWYTRPSSSSSEYTSTEQPAHTVPAAEPADLMTGGGSSKLPPFCVSMPIETLE